MQEDISRIILVKMLSNPKLLSICSVAVDRGTLMELKWKIDDKEYPNRVAEKFDDQMREFWMRYWHTNNTYIESWL